MKSCEKFHWKLINENQVITIRQSTIDTGVIKIYQCSLKCKKSISRMHKKELNRWKFCLIILPRWFDWHHQCYSVNVAVHCAVCTLTIRKPYGELFGFFSRGNKFFFFFKKTAALLFLPKSKHIEGDFIDSNCKTFERIFVENPKLFE